MSKPHLKNSGVLIALVSGLVAAVWLATTSGPASASVAQTAAALATETESDDDSSGRDALREDMDKARELEGDERREALEDIREKAENGDYGDLPDRRGGMRGGHGPGGFGGPGGPGAVTAEDSPFFALLPDELQDDLTEARDADADEREALMEAIREKALAGDYGDKVKEAWTLLEERREKFEENRPERGDDSGTSESGGDSEPSSYSPV